MKRIKLLTGRMLALMLVGALTMGSLSVPAFGAEDFEDIETASEMAVEEAASETNEAGMQDQEEEKAPAQDAAVTEPDSDDDMGRTSDGAAADDAADEEVPDDVVDADMETDDAFEEERSDASGPNEDDFAQDHTTADDSQVEAPRPGEDQDGDTPAKENADEAVSGEADEPDHTDPQSPIESDGQKETVSTDAEMSVVESGTCGKNLTWTLDENGLLTILGKGNMYDYEDGGPWYNQNIEVGVENVVISSGVTSIGDNAFANGYILNLPISN